MTSNALIAAGHPGLASAIHKYVGSFEKARRLAKLPSPSPLVPTETERWDEARVIGDIRELHQAGKSVAYKQVPTKLVDAALYYCGSWREAVELAGIDYASIRRSSPAWTPEKILASLRAASRSKRRGVGRDGAITGALSLAASRTFGSLRAAIKKANLDPGDLLRRTRLNDRELATALRKLIRQRPGLTLGDLNKAPLGRVVQRRFGNATGGLRKLGIVWTAAPPRRRPPPPRRQGGRGLESRGRKSRVKPPRRTRGG